MKKVKGKRISIENKKIKCLTYLVTMNTSMHFLINKVRKLKNFSFKCSSQLVKVK